MNITVYYSCHTCALEKVSCSVPARVDEDLMDWMDATMRLLAFDHKSHSPTCGATSLQNLMIPVTGSDKVGGPSVQ